MHSFHKSWFTVAGDTGLQAITPCQVQQSTQELYSQTINCLGLSLGQQELRVKEGTRDLCELGIQWAAWLTRAQMYFTNECKAQKNVVP